MVYVDNFYETGAGQFGRMKMSHMIADTHEELLQFVDKLGLARKWIQEEGTAHEHFDVCMSVRKKAISLGAKAIHYKELAEMTAARADKVMAQKAYCKDCGCEVAPGNDYCGECLCEDDSDYL